VDQDDVEVNENTNELLIRDGEDVGKVLDGQHRIEGLSGYTGEEEFQLPVTIFVDMDIEDQAMVFATINLQQTKVNRSLAYDLYEYTKKRSPQKTAHNIVRLLDREASSPVGGKIKMLGNVRDRQAQFIDSLLPLMSRDPMGDRNLYLKGKKPERADSAESIRYIFLNMFLDELDEEIAVVLWNYFGPVSDRWQSYWNEETVKVG